MLLRHISLQCSISFQTSTNYLIITVNIVVWIQFFTLFWLNNTKKNSFNQTVLEPASVFMPGSPPLPNVRVSRFYESLYVLVTDHWSYWIHDFFAVSDICKKPIKFLLNKHNTKFYSKKYYRYLTLFVINYIFAPLYIHKGSKSD